MCGFTRERACESRYGRCCCPCWWPSPDCAGDSRQYFGNRQGRQGVVPGATVTITALTRVRRSKLVTNGSGYFEAPLLQPGNYSVIGRDDRLQEADALRHRAGRRPAAWMCPSRSRSVSVQRDDHRHRRGAAARHDCRVVRPELRQPHGRRPADDLEHADHADAFRAGRESVDQPEPGVAGFRRRHHVGAAGSAVGGVGSNNYSIDGAHNGSTGRRIATSPNSDMIQEMRVESSNFDASVGHGTGPADFDDDQGRDQCLSRHGELHVLDEQVQRAEPEPEGSRSRPAPARRSTTRAAITTWRGRWAAPW